MQAFRPFELKAIRLMAEGTLSEAQLISLDEIGLPLSYEYTGCGYFLTVVHSSLPTEKKTLSIPPVVGKAGNIQAGFVVFLGNQELTLECHTWGEVDVPENFRDLDVAIETPPIQFIEPKN